jgi:hypothetical protein
LPVRKEVCNVKEADLEGAHEKAYISLQSRKKDRVVYSEEAYTEPLNARSSVDIGPTEVAKRLRDVFPPSDFNTKIIVVLRRQQDLLLSWYSFMYHANFRESPIKSIDHLIRTGINEDLRYSRAFLEWMDFEKVLDAYAESFGPERVCVLAYEDFRQSQEAFLRRLCDAIGIDVQEAFSIMERGSERNVSRSESGYHKPSRLHNILSQIKSKYLHFLDSPRKYFVGRWVVDTLRNFRSQPIEISQDTMELLQVFYGAKNKRVEEKYGIDLESRGYFVES